MDVQVNFLGVLAAFVVSMLVGSIWYSHKLFAKEWIKLARVDTSKNGSMIKPLSVTMVAALITAYILAHVSYLSNQFFGNSFLQDSLTTAFWMWLGFTASRIITHDVFEGRPAKLSLITLGCELVTLLGMGLVIGLIGV